MWLPAARAAGSLHYYNAPAERIRRQQTMAQYLFRKLTTRLVTTFALLAIPGALLIGFSSYYMARSTLQAGIFDKLESISSIKERNLRWWISELKTDIEWIAGSEELRQPLRVYLIENEDNEDVFYAYQRMADVLSDFIKHDIDLQELFLLNRDDGRVFISTEMSNVGDYGVDDGYFIKGLDETFFQKIYTSPGILKPQTIISSPVVSMYGEKLAVLAARANLESVDKILMSEAGLGKSGEAYLVDRLNNFVSAQRFGRENYPRGVHSQGIDAGVKEVDGRGLYVNYEGVPVIGVYHWLEDLGLVLMTEIHQDEAFSPARRLGWSLFLIGMSIAAVLLLGSHIISGRIARPILMVRDAAARVAQGDLLAKAPVVTGDEVGMLAASFNEMTDHLENLYNAMQTSEEHFRTVFRMSPDAISVIRMSDETFVDINEGFTNITGFTRDEIIGSSTRSAGIWIDEGSRETFLDELREKEYLDKQEVKFFKKDRSVFVSSISARKVEIRGEPHRISVIRDVTRLREAQDELQRTNTILRTQMELSISGILVVDEKGDIASCNHRFLEMWDLPPEILNGGSYEDITTAILGKVVDPDGFLEKRRTMVEKREARYEGEIALTDGRIFEEYAAPMLGEENKYYGRVAYFRDITESRRSEENLRSSVMEKEVLLQEIHHRVKNNLQVISGLLDLQSYHITDAKSKEIYKESQNRVITMALIHEELYQARDLARVDYGIYIRNLAGNLFKSYAVDPEKVKLELDVEDVQLVVDTAIPCGLIINELVSNALKHAFPGNREGKVQIIFKLPDDGRYHLEVRDNGIGIPEDFDMVKTPSLGLHLVTVLVSQLAGDMEIKTEEGTSFIIDFAEYLEAGAKLY